MGSHLYNPRVLRLVYFWQGGAHIHASVIALMEENTRGVSVHMLLGTHGSLATSRPHGSCETGFAGLVTSLHVRDNTVLLDG